MHTFQLEMRNGKILSDNSLVGLSLERPYLKQSQKLMHAKIHQNPWISAKIPQIWRETTDFGKISADFQNPLISKSADFLGKTKDHLPKKVTPIFYTFFHRIRRVYYGGCKATVVS